MFDSACVYAATERGCALTYPNQRVSPLSGEGSSELLSFEINLNEDKYEHLRMMECVTIGLHDM